MEEVNININKSSTDYDYLFNTYKRGYFTCVGSVAGMSENTSTIENCSSSGTINLSHSFTAFVGGIVGRGPANNSSNYINIDVFADGSTIRSSTVFCGGVCGSSGNVCSPIYNCFNAGNISVTGGIYVHTGGISGQYGNISNCANSGNIYGTTLDSAGLSTSTQGCDVGGIVGNTSSDYVKYCVNYGDIEAHAKKYGYYNGAYAGGIVGVHNYGKILSCVNISKRIISTKLDSNNNTINASTGAIAGKVRSLSDCYTVGTTILNNQQVQSGVSRNGTIIDETDVLLESTYVDFDFNSIWYIDANLGGAVLRPHSSKSATFYQYSYMADIWLNQNGRSNTWESRFIEDVLLKSDRLCSIVAEGLKTDKWFQIAINEKDAIDYIFDPVSQTKESMNRTQLNETVILAFFLSVNNNWIYAFLKDEKPDIYSLYLREELRQNIYTPSCYALLGPDGKTQLSWNVPTSFIGSDGNSYTSPATGQLDTVTVTENVAGHIQTKTDDIFKMSNPVDFYYDAGLATFPKKYSVFASSKTLSGTENTNTETTSLLNPIKTPALKVLNGSLTIYDTTSWLYDVQYEIYRDGELVNTIDKKDLKCFYQSHCPAASSPPASRSNHGRAYSCCATSRVRKRISRRLSVCNPRGRSRTTTAKRRS